MLATRMRSAAGIVRAALWNSADKGANVTLSNGDRAAVKITAGFEAARSTILLENMHPSGKLYFEFDHTGLYSALMGIMNSSASLTAFVGSDANGWGYQWNSQPEFYHNGASTNYGNVGDPPNAVPFTAMLAINLNNQKMWAGADGVWRASGDPGADTNEMGFGTAIPATGGYLAFSGQGDGATGQASDIRTQWAYTPPDGFTFIGAI